MGELTDTFIVLPWNVTSSPSCASNALCDPMTCTMFRLLQSPPRVLVWGRHPNTAESWCPACPGRLKRSLLKTMAKHTL
jgi:hypothetical protein